MLKTNSKKAEQNIRAYILAHYDGSNYAPESDSVNGGDFSQVAKFILDIFDREKYYNDAYAQAHHIPKAQIFAEWCAGLPSVLDTCYYYNRSAVDDLAAILEESDEEKSRYNDAQAEEFLTRLIWRELCKGATK